MEVLTASVRKLDHLLYAIKLGSDIITSPFNVLEEWGGKGLPMPDAEYRYDHGQPQAHPLRGDRAVERLAGV